MYRILVPTALAALALTACTAPTELTLTEDLSELADSDFDTRTVLVGYPKAMGPQVRLRGTELPVLRDWSRMGLAELEVPAGEDALDVVEELRGSFDVTFAEPNLMRHASSVNDPFYSYQWNLTAIDAEGAWATTTGTGAIIAVIDTGVSTAGDDAPSLVSAGYDFVDGDNDPTDLNGHGTHVAGTVAGATDNAIGVASVAPDSQVMAIRVLDASGSGTAADVIDGILYAANNGADVINMSLGSRWGSSAEESAVQYAEAAGLVIVAASGNSGSRKGVDYPGAYAEVIAVGATDTTNSLPRYSNRGNDLELVAPGGDVSKDDNGDGYADGVLQETFESGVWGYYFWQGTSMAAPHVAGVAGLLSSMGATNDEIRSILQSTAQDLGSAGWDKNFGYGLVDASAAVAAYGGTTDTGTTDTGTTDTGTTDTGTTDVTAPTISGVSHSTRGRKVRVTFSTDEAATGEVCFDDGSCGTTALGTSHSTNVRTSGNSYTVTATDAAGNSATEGPYSL